MSAYDGSDSVQVALLREKLAKEQQRARAAEATLAAQHQMQQLLQSAVQAVLLARSGAQVLMHACLTPNCGKLLVCVHKQCVPIVSLHINTPCHDGKGEKIKFLSEEQGSNQYQANMPQHDTQTLAVACCWVHVKPTGVAKWQCD